MRAYPSRPLGDVADVSSGVTKGRQLSGPTVTVPYLRVANVQAGHVVVDDVSDISILVSELERYRLQAGDVLMTEGGDPDKLGRGALWMGEIDPCIHQNHVFRVRLDRSKVEPRYFARFLGSRGAVAYFLRAAKQTTGIATINKTQLSALPVPLPPLPEQRHIADILDKADAIRRKRKEAIALTEELLRAAFLEMFGDPVTNPKGWEVKRFSETLTSSLRNGLSPASGGTHHARVLTLSAITRGAWDRLAAKDGAFSVEPWQDVRVDTRDFLICRGNGNRSLVGSGEFPDASDGNMVFPDTIIAARPDSNALQREYLSLLWKTPCVRRQIESSARTTNGTFKVNQTAIENVRVPVPPVTLQQTFGSLVMRAKQLRTRYEHGGYDALFESYVDSVFSGRLS